MVEPNLEQRLHYLFRLSHGLPFLDDPSKAIETSLHSSLLFHEILATYDIQLPSLYSNIYCPKCSLSVLFSRTRIGSDYMTRICMFCKRKERLKIEKREVKQVKNEDKKEMKPVKGPIKTVKKANPLPIMKSSNSIASPSLEDFLFSLGSNETLPSPVARITPITPKGSSSNSNSLGLLDRLAQSKKRKK